MKAGCYGERRLRLEDLSEGYAVVEGRASTSQMSAFAAVLHVIDLQVAGMSSSKDDMLTY